MSELGLMVLKSSNKKKWEIFSHFFLFLPLYYHKWAFFKISHFCKSLVLNIWR